MGAAVDTKWDPDYFAVSVKRKDEEGRKNGSSTRSTIGSGIKPFCTFIVANIINNKQPRQLTDAF